MKLSHLLPALACALSVSAHALDYTTVTLPTLNTDIGTLPDGAFYNPYFPSLQTVGEIPFLLQDDQGNNAFMSGNLSMTVDIASATTVYTLINTAWGTADANVGSIDFLSQSGSKYTVHLIEGLNVRSYEQGSYVNEVSPDYVTRAVLGSDSGVRLDMQTFDLPATLQTEGLSQIVFHSKNTAPGNPLRGTPFLAGVTVATAPVSEPKEFLMLLGGLCMLGVMVHRRSADPDC